MNFHEQHPQDTKAMRGQNEAIYVEIPTPLCKVNTQIFNMNLSIGSTSRNTLKNQDTTYMRLRHPSCILLHVKVFNRSTRMQIFKQPN